MVKHIGDNAYVDGDINVGYHWHITGKCRGYVHRVNHKVHFVFHNLKDDLYLNTKKIDKFNLKINFTPHGLEKFLLHKKWSFPLKISSVNVTNSAENCGFWSHLLKKPLMENSIFLWSGLSFSINNRLNFVDWFKFLRSLDSLAEMVKMVLSIWVKNLIITF